MWSWYTWHLCFYIWGTCDISGLCEYVVYFLVAILTTYNPIIMCIVNLNFFLEQGSAGIFDYTKRVTEH